MSVLWRAIFTFLFAATPAMLVGCSSPDAPTTLPTLVSLTIEASARCEVGSGGLPLRSYTVVMQDRRSGADWRFVENRDTSGPREQVLVLDLVSAGGSLTGSIWGPAIIDTAQGRMTVFPQGRPGGVSATATETELVGVWEGRLLAYLLDGGPTGDCNATDHRIRLALPGSRP